LNCWWWALIDGEIRAPVVEEWVVGRERWREREVDRWVEVVEVVEVKWDPGWDSWIL